MSKTTKALAILGVVAGLGVSTLPMSSYAVTYYDRTDALDGDATNAEYDDAAVVDTTDPKNPGNGIVAGDMLIKTTIDSTLSLEITGNDDGHSVDDSETTKSVLLLGKLKADGTAGGASDPVTGKLMVGSSDEQTANLVVTTNYAKGYTLSMKGTSTDLVGNDTTAGNKIPAVTDETQAMNGTVSAFGYKVGATDRSAASKTNQTGILEKENGVALGTTNTWRAVSTTAAPIAYAPKATSKDGDAYDVTFGVSVAQNQAADTYKNTITFTATAKAH